MKIHVTTGADFHEDRRQHQSAVIIASLIAMADDMAATLDQMREHLECRRGYWTGSEADLYALIGNTLARYHGEKGGKA